MEINITSFVTNQDPYEYSASRCELGENAASITWNNALAADTLLTTPEQIEALREYVKGFGAWSREEIAAWSDKQCNALFVQLISGDLREAGFDNVELDEFDWQEYEERQQAGSISSNVFRGNDGQVYYYLGD
jgi:hypothetical protein